MKHRTRQKAFNLRKRRPQKRRVFRKSQTTGSNFYVEIYFDEGSGQRYQSHFKAHCGPKANIDWTEQALMMIQNLQKGLI